MPRTARVNFPAKDVFAALGLPPNARLISAQAQHQGRLILTVEHGDLIDHDGMRPPFVDPKFARGDTGFEWAQKPPVLMGEDGAAQRAERQARRDANEGKAT